MFRAEHWVTGQCHKIRNTHQVVRRDGIAYTRPIAKYEKSLRQCRTIFVSIASHFSPVTGTIVPFVRRVIRSEAKGVALTAFALNYSCAHRLPAEFDPCKR